MSNREKLIAGVGALLLFVLLVVAVRQLFTLEATGANDFYPRWKGTTLFWLDRVDPYSDVATEAIQMDMYSRLALPEEDQVLFVYPFYVTFMLFPLIWLPLDYAWLQAFWMTILLFSLVGGVLIIQMLLGWKLSPSFFGAFLFWAVISYYSVRIMILGQFAGLIFLFMMATLLALQRGRDGLAGFLLIWTTVKPQMVVFVITALLLWAITHKRWRFVGFFSAGMGFLFVLSFLLLPGWFSSFVDQVFTYPIYTTHYSSPLNWLNSLFPWLGLPGKRLIQLALLGWMVWEWWKLPIVTAVATDLFQILGVTMITTLLIFDQTATTNQVLLYLPLLLGLYAIAQASPRRDLPMMLLITLTVVPWVLFLITIRGDLEHPVMYWPLPLLAMILLTIGRPFIQQNVPNPHPEEGRL